MAERAPATPRSPAFAALETGFQAVREGQVSAGVLRCRPKDAEAVVGMIVDRTKELGGCIQQLVRLVRLAALCRRHPLEFFYTAVGSFRAENFRRAITENSIPSTVIRLEDDGVVFLEPDMRAESGKGKAFDLGFNQMPRIATLLEVLHNTFGYDALYFGAPTPESGTSGELIGIFRAIVTESPEPAYKVASRLQSCFNRWLTEALGTSAYEERQADAIADFLRDRPVGFEAINDELIFDFWRCKAVEPGNSDGEGFKLYRSAVRAMLRYRRALAIAQIAESSMADPDDVARGRKNAVEDDREWFDTPRPELMEWHSPMAVLGPLCDTVKWLLDTERQRLKNHLGAVDIHNSGEMSGPEDGTAGALMGPERFDLRFAVTLLRIDVFAKVQNDIIAALRRKRPAEEALKAALIPIDEMAYEKAKQEYAGIREAVIKAVLASIHVLGIQGDPNALVLIAPIFGRGSVQYFTDQTSEAADVRSSGQVSEERLSTISTELRSAFSKAAVVPVEIGDIVRRTKSALEKLPRKGFLPQDRSDPKVREAFQEGAHALVSLLDELERILNRLDQLPLQEATKADRIAFTKVFRRLYAREPGAPPAPINRAQ
jgi:hypothetical protein